MTRGQINNLLALPLLDLLTMADKVRRKYTDNRIELCNIMNAKSGRCSEDCKFCAQSSRHHTGIPQYPLKSEEEMIAAAHKAKEIGAERFDIVTSGNKLSLKEVEVISEAIRYITSEIGIKMCASLGSLDERAFRKLKQAGLTRYHHNIETSQSYFSKIVTTHSFQERINTIKAAKSVGLEVCSGGIIGLGESMQDRVKMALLLKELDVDSVPINVLVPIKGTPFENRERLSCEESIRTIAIFRIILKDRIIKVAAGRDSALKDFQSMLFMAGANGMLIGGYLTIKGRSVEEDLQLVKEVERLWQQ